MDVNAVGRRKASIARVYLKKGKGKVEINGKEYKDYIPQMHLQDAIVEPLVFLELQAQYDVKVNVTGGGIKGQAEAIRLGIARCLILIDEENKPLLKAKDSEMFKRDARKVERKKVGFRKARKKEQYSKR